MACSPSPGTVPRPAHPVCPHMPHRPSLCSGILPGLQQLEEEEKGTLKEAPSLSGLDKEPMAAGFLEHDAIRGKGRNARECMGTST